jgi:hypothetical protein
VIHLHHELSGEQLADLFDLLKTLGAL